MARRCQPVAPKRYLRGFHPRTRSNIKIHVPLSACVKYFWLLPMNGWSTALGQQWVFPEPAIH